MPGWVWQGAGPVLLAGPVGYTLTAEPGSFAWTGAAASLEHGRRLDAAAGSLAWTGAATSLEHDRRLNAESGSLALSGQDVSLKHARSLVAGAGSFALTGAAASLEHGRALSAGTGSFAWTGADATLTYTPLGGYTLVADAGSFSWSGAAAALEHGRVLSAAAGSFSLTGAAASLLQDRRLSSSSGGFAWTGSDANLLYGQAYILDAQAGSLALTGADAGLYVGRAVSAEAGSYGWTGAAVGLGRTYRLEAEAGAFALSGAAAGLHLGRRLSAEAGSFALSGSAVSLLQGRVLAAEAGAFAWTGSSAELEYSAGWSPSWGLEDKYLAELAASDVIAVLSDSKTKADLFSSGELAVLGAALIHFWPLSDYADQQGGPTFVPQSGSPSFEAGLIGNAVRVNASDGNLLASALDIATIDGGGSFSAAGWFKANQASSSVSLLYAWGSPPANLWFLDNNFAQNEAELFISGTAGTLRATVAHIGDVGVWVFLCGVYDESDETSTLYYGIDGAALQSVNGAKSGWVGPRKTGSADLRSCYFTVGDVTVDHLKIWDVALTASQAEGEYAAVLAAA